MSEKVGDEKNKKKKVDVAGILVCRGLHDSWIDQSYDLRETQLPKPHFRCLFSFWGIVCVDWIFKYLVQSFS